MKCRFFEEIFSSKKYTILKLVLHGQTGWQYSRKRTISKSFQNHNADKSTDRPRPINQSTVDHCGFSYQQSNACSSGVSCFFPAFFTHNSMSDLLPNTKHKEHMPGNSRSWCSLLGKRWTPLSLTPIQLHCRFSRKHVPPRLVPPPLMCPGLAIHFFEFWMPFPEYFRRKKKRKMLQKIDVLVRTRSEQNLCRGCSLIRC